LQLKCRTVAGKEELRLLCEKYNKGPIPIGTLMIEFVLNHEFEKEV
jgi:hypothetical protein